MIKEIKITNFYSFSQETIILRPDVNVLIGINGSGKSNFFKAVQLLKEGVTGVGLRKYIINVLGGFDNAYFKNANPNHPLYSNKIILEYLFDFRILNDATGLSLAKDIEYQIQLLRYPGVNNYFVIEHVIDTLPDTFLRFDHGSGFLQDERNSNRTDYKNFIDSSELALSKVFDTERFPILAALHAIIDNAMVYNYFDTMPHSNIRRPIIATSDKRLNTDGSNLAQILNTIKINYKQAYNKIVEMLTEVNPNFTGFDFNIVGSGNIELMLEEKGLNSSVHVSSISDGTLKYLCLLAILYNPERGKFICIDEPELGLHPDMIRVIANAIKEAAQQSTIIVATHSVGLLDYFKIENLQVFEKDESNATRVITFKEEQFEGWYDNLNVGQMWVAGDFGGVRYGG